MRMTPTQMTCLARLVSDLRSEWDFHGVAAAVRKLSEQESNFTACHMALRAAADPTANTPGAMNNPVYRDTPAPSVNHAPSSGRDNVIRLRAEMAELDARKAGPHQIAAIRAAQTITNPRSET